MKEYIVYLIKSDYCVRGYLAYLSPKYFVSKPTHVITVMAENGSKAKNKAITLINKQCFEGEGKP